ncbi:E3 ubiquitin-protein ligase MARCHF3-like isoform X2 [Mangifera indica]|uniref:E3 ubiquitin-protein ligase MARCHF3-like isoform X2 n=1 Tax=Mangifera indica TaxID=29780 RepID=UPI001CFA38AC|nr:E3 ubiquitin-protein ligase MARCHF3-like isoform X2 [Mangifera indica]
MQHEGSNAEQDLERQGNNNHEVSGVEDNSALPTIVISDGDSHQHSSNDELPQVLSPKKGYLSRTGSSQEQCRVCQQDKEEALIDLGCKCRGGLAKAHRSCIDTWFHSKGSNKCEICQEVAANVPLPETQPVTNYLVWSSINQTFRSQDRERVGVMGCFSPLWVAFSILIGGLILDVLISITLGVAALPVNIIIGVIVVLGLGTALRLALEFCHEWSLRRVGQRVDTNVAL